MIEDYEKHKPYESSVPNEQRFVEFYDMAKKMNQQIVVTSHRNFNIGNAIKYLWRAGLKESVGKDTLEKQVEDLRKAVFYINDEIARLTGDSNGKA